MLDVAANVQSAGPAVSRPTPVCYQRFSDDHQVCHYAEKSVNFLLKEL